MSVHVAEAARIVIGDDGPARHGEYQMVVLGVASVLVGVLAELGSLSPLFAGRGLG